jgi:hydroxymethylglutaryl-CoA lyase/(R)-citramalyl-CoA lyase
VTRSPRLCDVGPRDGLQNEAVTLAPLVRAELSERLARAGLRAVEVGSFVSPRAVPQMAGTELVFAALHRDPDVTYSALVLNARGLERAVAAAADEVHIAYPLSDSFSLRNQNMTLEQAASAAAEMVGQAHARELPATVTLGAAFGCPFEGRIDPGVVVEHVRRMATAGADAIMLADTIGAGVPTQVRALVPAALDAAAGRPVGLHLHNTRNTGYANADAGLGAGATILDASIGGLGGCPFAPRATGNIATEDLVYMLEQEGIDTGVDLDELIAVSEWLASVMQAELPGLVHRAGRFVPLAAG